MGAEEIFITPLNGEYMAMMMNTAAETASAQVTSVTRTAFVGRAKSPKLRKMMVNQETTTASRGNERLLCSDRRNINQ